VQWNPVNQATKGPQKSGRINSVAVKKDVDEKVNKKELFSGQNKTAIITG